MAMRPPLPNLALSRRAKIVLWTIAILIVLIVVLVQFSGVYINFLWFDSVGFRGVYTTIFWTRFVLFFVFGGLMGLILGGNMLIAYLLSPPFRPMSAEQQNIERYRAFLEPRRWWIVGLVTGLSLLAEGLSAQDDWARWQLWLHGGSFGITDPQYHLDVSFYAWDYPVYRLMLSFGYTAVIFAILLSLIVHYLTGAIRFQTPGPKVTVAARRHLTLLVFVFVVLKALAYWLDRYGLVFSDRSKFTGASYTDVHAVLPARTILFWIALVIAAALIASLWLRSTLLPGIAFVSMLIMSILIGGIYPAALQNFSVKPNAASKESPYILRNIEATRQAYDIVPGRNVVTDPNYPATPTPDPHALNSNSPTLANIRVLDPNLMSPTFTAIERIRQQYGFADKLDVDRYTINKKTRDYIVGVRELDASALSGDQTNWINQHTVYTHGYGFVAAEASNENATKSNAYASGGINSQGPIGAGLRQPAEYYGELLPDYSIVGAEGTPQEFNGDGNRKVTYSGPGGVSLGNFFTRLAFAVNYKQTNFLLNDAASASGAKIIFDRNPRAMVQKVAPYLTVDGDPYPFVDPQSGHIMWMVDAYTTMDNFPYSQRNSLADLTADSLTTNGQTAGQPNSQINYIRNSVKATVDAYTGQVTLYDWDPSDPVLQAWMKVFPGTVQPASAMPTDVREHVRYPQALFEVQRAMLGTYHVSDPVTFYNVGDKWTVPNDPIDKLAYQPPYYVLAAPPGDLASSKSEFQLTSPMIVNNSTNLAAYISVNCDPGTDYGKMTVLRVPENSATRGPEQVNNILNTNPTITANLNLFDNAGSTPLAGNLLTLPVNGSFLYVEPVYIQGTGNGAYPTLQRVLVVYGNAQVGFEQTLAGALQDIRTGQLGRNLNTPTQNTTPPPTTSGTTTPPPTKSPTSTPTTRTTTPPAVALPSNDPRVKAAWNQYLHALASHDSSQILQAIARLSTLGVSFESTPPAAGTGTSTASTPPSSTAPSGGSSP